MKKSTKKDTVLLFFAGALLFCGGLSLLFFPTPRFSATENRLLADRPCFTWQALKDGSYTAAWERYAAERMMGRRAMRGVHGAVELALGKCEVSNVLLCRDGSLAKRLEVNERIYQKNLNALATLTTKAKETGSTLTVAIAPRRIDARADVLPSLYRQSDDNMPHIKLSEQLPQALPLDHITEDAQWYRTDHHWSTAGAFAAYQAIVTQLGLTPYGETDFSRETVSSSFWGTTDAAAGFLDISPDTIELWRYKGDEALLVTKDGKPAAFTGLYDFSRLSTRDGYAVFLGGNDGIAEITMGESDTRPTLLVIKDSFANSVIPFLARHYRIIAIDPRYTTVSISDYIKKADHTLLLCGMQTLTEVAMLENI